MISRKFPFSVLILILASCAFVPLAGCSSNSPFNPAIQQWLWEGGSNTANGSSSYGTLRTPAASNTPPARQAATHWSDTNGNLWMFGGMDGTTNGTANNLNDLWQYGTNVNLWSWQSGSSTPNALGVYGTMGTPAAANTPGARNSSMGWTDATGNIWLFGGDGYAAAGTVGVLNDLWEFNTTNGLWTWMGGSNTTNAPGSYGTLGVAAATNMPSARRSAITWIDYSGNFWLFGGQNTDANSTQGFLNDLWMYSPKTGLWTWVGGSNTPNASGSYGTMGTSAASNIPGARISGASWTDGNGNLWLFGGNGFDSTGTQGNLNDLWEYNPVFNTWTWVTGASTVGAAGVYGTQGIYAATNTPGARMGAVAWSDLSGNLWLFGGYGFDSTGTQGYLNDLWSYNFIAQHWIWISGSTTANAPGVYGSLNMPGATDTPGGKTNAVGWTDEDGNFWLFGGQQNSTSGSTAVFNDLWFYQP